MTDTQRWLLAGLMFAFAVTFFVVVEVLIARPYRRRKWDLDLWDWIYAFHGTREDFEKHRGPRP